MLLPGRAPAGRRHDATARARSPSEAGLDLERLTAVPPGARARGARPRRASARRGRPRGGARTRRALAEAGFPREDTLEVTRVLGRGHGPLRRGAAHARSPRRSSSRATRRARARAPAREPGRRAAAARRAAARPRLPAAHAPGAAQRRAGIAERTLRARSRTRTRHGGRVRRPRRLHRAGGDRRRRGARRASRAGCRSWPSEVVEPPVRVVKQIGDAVMLVSPDAEAAGRICARAVERAEAPRSFPPLRAGVAYGPAVNRWGDWFGSTVNVASRLTARARPASVLATEEVKDAGRRRRFAVVVRRREEAQGPLRAAEDLPRAQRRLRGTVAQPRWGRVSALTKSSSWRGRPALEGRRSSCS